MQLVDGTTLKQEIGSKPMDFGRAATLLKQLGSALSAAHDRGICHRDLKLENIKLQLRRLIPLYSSAAPPFGRTMPEQAAAEAIVVKALSFEPEQRWQ